MKLTVIIPIYNEASTLAALLDRVVAVDIDKEMTKLAENNLMYKTGVEALLRKLAALKHAIIEGGK